MYITSTSSVEGYQISAYLGLVTGADIYLAAGLIGEGIIKQNRLFFESVKKASKQLQDTADSLGADAVIGVQSSTAAMSAGGGNVIVTLIGTAVKLKKDDSPDKRIKKDGLLSDGNTTIDSFLIRKTNAGQAFYPHSILFRNNRSEIALQITDREDPRLSGIAAEVILTNLFGEEYITPVLSFIGFHWEAVNQIKSASASVPCEIPENFRTSVCHVDLRIRKYVRGEEIITVEEEELLNNEDVLASSFGDAGVQELVFADFKKAYKDTNLALQTFTMYESGTEEQKITIANQIRDMLAGDNQ